jgi:DNA polymerase I-like protein with 3'-5' exonuclease and polymerase domains
MKKALIVLDGSLQKAGLRPGTEYEFVGNIHDEAQAEILPSIQDIYAEKALECLPNAGRLLRLHCLLASEVSFGSSWRETH